MKNRSDVTHTHMITRSFHFNHTHTLKQSIKILQISSSQTKVSSEHIFLFSLRGHDETTTPVTHYKDRPFANNHPHKHAAVLK